MKLRNPIWNDLLATLLLVALLAGLFIFTAEALPKP